MFEKVGRINKLPPKKGGGKRMETVSKSKPDLIYNSGSIEILNAFNTSMPLYLIIFHIGPSINITRFRRGSGTLVHVF